MWSLTLIADMTTWPSSTAGSKTTRAALANSVETSRPGVLHACQQKWVCLRGPAHWSWRSSFFASLRGLLINGSPLAPRATLAKRTLATELSSDWLGTWVLLPCLLPTSPRSSIRSDGNELLVQFVSDPSVTADGFSASYVMKSHDEPVDATRAQPVIPVFPGSKPTQTSRKPVPPNPKPPIKPAGRPKPAPRPKPTAQARPDAAGPTTPAAGKSSGELGGGVLGVALSQPGPCPEPRTGTWEMPALEPAWTRTRMQSAGLLSTEAVLGQRGSLALSPSR